MPESADIAALPVSDPRAVRAREQAAKLARAHQLDRIGTYLIKAAGILVVLGVGMILVFLMLEALPLLTNPSKHREASLDKMFVPQKYEGYTEPDYVWQTESTAGGEEKFGVPLLMWGTLKGALWAMFFSTPLALLSALFVAEFSGPRSRTVIKSSIEVLAGIPTVVVGFFAFVVLSTIMNDYYNQNKEYFTGGGYVVFLLQILFVALMSSYLIGKVSVMDRPLIQKIVMSAGLFILSIAAAFIFGRAVLAALGSGFGLPEMPLRYLFFLGLGGYLVYGIQKQEGGQANKAFLSVVALLFSFGIAYATASILAHGFKPMFGVTKFTQLNGVLAGFCLGFAIVPLIFSVAEDAMRAVPNSFREASLALGASRWETALRVIVPSATPGIYAAMMLGLARAVGETMIILMASGNTPILDFSAFTGMRTMSAAIAIEASEKAQYSTGYHVLFFVGALLFLITFVLNAATEHVITKLKSKYQVG